MINTNKLIPNKKESSRKTIKTIGLIKKDVVKIDSLLKEKLVLSKVRYGILRQQDERRKRFGRESILESKKNKSQDYDVNLKSNKKGKGLGGFLGGILKSVLTGLGFTIFTSLPALLKIGKTLKAIITPFTIGATVFITAIARIASAGSKVIPVVKGKNFKGASEKSIKSGIENLKNALYGTAIAFIGGALGGKLVERLVRGKTFTSRQAASFLETQKAELRKGRSVKARELNKKIRSERQRRLMVDDNFATTPRSKTLTELAEQQVATEMTPRTGRKITKKIVNLPPNMTPQQYERIYGESIYDEIGEGSTVSSKSALDRTVTSRTGIQKELFTRPKAPKKDLRKHSPISITGSGGEEFFRTRIKKPKKVGIGFGPMITGTVADASRVSMDPMEIAVQPRMVDLADRARKMGLTEKQISKVIARERTQFANLLKLLPESELQNRHEDIYKRFTQARKDIAAERAARRIAKGIAKSNLAGTGRIGTSVTSSGKVGQKVFRRPDGTSTLDAYKAAQREIFGKEFKKTGMEIGMAKSKKGLSKILFNFGGEALEQSVKQTIKASVGVIPVIGDLIGLLLDVFLFGQPVGRAAFMAVGSFLGSLIGGVFGLIGGPPGAFVGGIVGGIGGDILGGALYDLIFKDGVMGKISEGLSQSFVKKGVKTGVGMGFMGGGYVPFGGIVHAGEFVIDADSTRAIERRSPGFLMALNNAKGSQVNEVLETYMSYGNEGEGSETLIPVPFEKIVTKTVIAGTGIEDGDDSISPFMDLYRRG